MTQTLLVTGGYGFIGSCYVLQRLEAGDRVVNLDAMTYAADPDNLAEVEHHPQFVAVKGSITDAALVQQVLQQYQPQAVVHFAAESHVDNSIAAPMAFVQTNIVGTAVLLQQALAYWQSMDAVAKSQFRFLHVSTDEVFGSLLPEDAPFSRTTPYDPRSPYSASKAASDHLVRAWQHTYGLPALLTNCSNNFGPRQHGEKLIPTIIRHCLTEQPIPVYGTGENIRDWIFVEDHCLGVQLALEKGVPGDTYLLGGDAERTNNQVVQQICAMMDRLLPRKSGEPYAGLVRYVTDRAGHDFRYAIDTSCAKQTLGFAQSAAFEVRLEETLRWYLRKWGTQMTQKNADTGGRDEAA